MARSKKKVDLADGIVDMISDMDADVALEALRKALSMLTEAQKRKMLAHVEDLLDSGDEY